METEILGVSDRLLAAVINGIYQGILITVLVALSFRVFRRTNAATRHAVWLCTLVLLVLLLGTLFFSFTSSCAPTGRDCSDHSDARARDWHAQRRRGGGDRQWHAN